MVCYSAVLNVKCVYVFYRQTTIPLAYQYNIREQMASTQGHPERRNHGASNLHILPLSCRCRRSQCRAGSFEDECEVLDENLIRSVGLAS